MMQQASNHSTNNRESETHILYTPKKISATFQPGHGELTCYGVDKSCKSTDQSFPRSGIATSPF